MSDRAATAFNGWVHCVITGTRNSTRPDCTTHMARFAARQSRPVVFILGDCPSGVDQAAWEWCVAQHFESPGTIDFLRETVDPRLPSPQRFHARNQAMVDLAPPSHWCLAFPDHTSKGTLDCAKRALARGLNVFFPAPYRNRPPGR